METIFFHKAALCHKLYVEESVTRFLYKYKLDLFILLDELQLYCKFNQKNNK